MGNTSWVPCLRRKYSLAPKTGNAFVANCCQIITINEHGSVNSHDSFTKLGLAISGTVAAAGSNG